MSRDNGLWTTGKGHWTVQMIKVYLFFFFLIIYQSDLRVWSSSLGQLWDLFSDIPRGHQGFWKHQRTMSVSRANRIYHSWIMLQDLGNMILTRAEIVNKWDQILRLNNPWILPKHPRRRWASPRQNQQTPEQWFWVKVV